jgi:hypothetical protein
MIEIQDEMPLDDQRRPCPETIRFAEYVRKHPHYTDLLTEAVRQSVADHGRCTLYHAREEVMLTTGAGPHKSFLPAYARLIAAECPDLRGKIATRPSRFGL